VVQQRAKSLTSRQCRRNPAADSLRPALEYFPDLHQALRLASKRKGRCLTSICVGRRCGRLSQWPAPRSSRWRRARAATSRTTTRRLTPGCLGSPHLTRPPFIVQACLPVDLNCYHLIATSTLLLTPDRCLVLLLHDCCPLFIRSIAALCSCYMIATVYSYALLLPCVAPCFCCPLLLPLDCRPVSLPIKVDFKRLQGCCKAIAQRFLSDLYAIAKRTQNDCKCFRSKPESFRSDCATMADRLHSSRVAVAK
jgi:hypothetical protein